MSFTIRRARRQDCAAIMELIRELAVYERAPDAVTVSLEHFEESGFGERPVWWAFVACASDSIKEEAFMEKKAQDQPVQDPLMATVIQGVPHTLEENLQISNAAALPDVPSGIKLEEAVTPTIPDPVREAMPLQAAATEGCGPVIGFALYYIRYSTWKGQRMFLEDLLVTEQWRGKGVGTALMDALIATARAEKLGGINWQVLDWNEPAIRFYERYSARFDPEWLNVTIEV